MQTEQPCQYCGTILLRPKSIIPKTCFDCKIQKRNEKAEINKPMAKELYKLKRSIIKQHWSEPYLINTLFKKESEKIKKKYRYEKNRI